jgi:hypothetical protein
MSINKTNFDDIQVGGLKTAPNWGDWIRHKRSKNEHSGRGKRRRNELGEKRHTRLLFHTRSVRSRLDGVEGVKCWLVGLAGSTLTQMRRDRLFASHCVNVCRFYQVSFWLWCLITPLISLAHIVTKINYLASCIRFIVFAGQVYHLRSNMSFRNLF